MDNDRKNKNNIKLIIFVIALALFTVLWQDSKNTGQVAEKAPVSTDDTSSKSYVEYTFANEDLLQDHYEKHGKGMGFESAEEYEKAASDVINNPAALHKTEAEDGDDVYYLESSNELVILSIYGKIRTYFLPDDGKAYFDRT